MKTFYACLFAASVLYCAKAANAQDYFDPNDLVLLHHILFVSNGESNQIVQVDQQSGAVRSIITDGVSTPTGLAYAGSLLYAANAANNTVTVYNTQTLQLTNTLSRDITAPQALVIDAYGDVYVANQNSAITVLRADGSVAELLAADNSGFPFTVPGAVGINGRNLWVGTAPAGAIGSLRAYNVGEFLTGDPQLTQSIQMPAGSPAGVAFDSSNNIYVALGTAGYSEKFSPTGQPLVTFQDPAGGQCKGIAVDPVSGTVYVANGAPINTISVFDQLGHLITTFR